MEILSIFPQKLFLIIFLKYVNKIEKIATFTFFMHVYIFSDCCLKNHVMFICHFVVEFLEILSKFSTNQVQKFLLLVFLNFLQN
jgi:hypothetical protein